MPVSAATETKLREAMARLLAGEPLHTDGDAKVSRPVLRTLGEVQRDVTITELRKQLREAKARVTAVQGKFDALAMVAANLYAENLALKKIGSRQRLAVIPAQDG